MANAPAAEIDIDVSLVRTLLGDQHPDLADRPFQPLANGWDNVLFRLGSDLIVRIPRRALAAELVAHEIAALPRIAALTDGAGVSVPAPVRVGGPAHGVPWRWTIVPWVDGVAAAVEPASARSRWAPALARFVCALHVAADADAPANPFRGIPLAQRDAMVAARLTGGGVPRGAELLDLWRRLVATPPYDGSPVWLHGDLHPANLIVRDGRLVSVVDFGDVTSGDPATDLAVAWLAFDAAGRAAFVTAVADVIGPDDDLWRRSRAWAVALTSAIAGGSDDHPVLAGIGAHAIRELLDAPDAGLV